MPEKPTMAGSVSYSVAVLPLIGKIDKHSHYLIIETFEFIEWNTEPSSAAGVLKALDSGANHLEEHDKGK